jgi:hypothetical protein
VRSENNHERYNMRHSYANIANTSVGVPDVIARQIFPRVVKIFDRMRTPFGGKKNKIKEHSRARVYIPRNGVKLRKATITWIKLLLAVSASRVAYGFDRFDELYRRATCL